MANKNEDENENLHGIPVELLRLQQKQKSYKLRVALIYEGSAYVRLLYT